jgi:leader peptidase (prepilin peptidase) / N-methyltransferase
MRRLPSRLAFILWGWTDRRNDKNVLRSRPAARYVTLADGLRLAVLAVVALAFGSFVATLALRLPAGASLWGRSRCPGCGAALAPQDLVPVLSWLLLKGRCRSCGAALGLYYPAVELAALGLALWAWSATEGGMLWASCALAWTLLALALIDLRHFQLPDALTLPLAAAGLAVAWRLQPDALLDDAAGAAAGYALFAAVAWAYRRWRGREGLGAGDAKLLGALGAWVGASGLPSVVLLASLLALAVALAARAVRSRGGWRGALQDRVPFGPALAAAGWIVWLYGPLAFG